MCDSTSRKPLQLYILIVLFSPFMASDTRITGVDLQWIQGIRSYYDKGDNTAIVTWEYHPNNASIVWIRCYYAKYAYKVRDEHVFTLRRDPEEGLYFRNLKDRGRYRLEDGIFKLLIDRPKSQDEGIYDCEFQPLGNKNPLGNRTELARSARLVGVRGSESSFLHGDRYGKVHFTLIPSNASINWVRCFKIRNRYTGEDEHVYTYRYVSGEGMRFGRLSNRSSHEVNHKDGTFMLMINMPGPEDVGEYKCEFASVLATEYPVYAVTTIVRHVPLKKITAKWQAFEPGDRLVKLEWNYTPSDATVYHVQCLYHPDATLGDNELHERVYAYDFRSHEETVYAKWRKNVYTSIDENGIFRMTIPMPKMYHAGVYKCRFQGSANTHHGAALRLVLIKRINNLHAVQEKTFYDGDKKVSLSWKYQPEDATAFDINCLHKKYLYKTGKGGKVCKYNYYNKHFETFELWKELLKYKIGSGSFVLTIINPQPRHEGVYECEFYSSKGATYIAAVKLIRGDHTGRKVKTTSLPSKSFTSFVSPFVQMLSMFSNCILFLKPW